MTHLLTSGKRAGAYLTGPVMPNPALLGYSSEFGAVTQTRPMSFPQTTTNPTQEPEFSDQAVAEAIERLTKTPGSSPEALQQAALDMELVISHFDSLSAAFGAEAALTSLALDLAGRSEQIDPVKTTRPRAVRSKTRRTAKALAT